MIGISQNSRSDYSLGLHYLLLLSCLLFTLFPCSSLISFDRPSCCVDYLSLPYSLYHSSDGSIAGPLNLCNPFCFFGFIASISCFLYCHSHILLNCCRCYLNSRSFCDNGSCVAIPFLFSFPHLPDDDNSPLFLTHIRCCWLIDVHS